MKEQQKKKGDKGKFRTIEIRENQHLSARVFLPAALFMKTSHASVPSLQPLAPLPAAVGTVTGGGAAVQAVQPPPGLPCLLPRLLLAPVHLHLSQARSRLLSFLPQRLGNVL